MPGTDGTTRPLVVVTGATGRVGRLTVRALRGRYRLRLVDLVWPVHTDGAAPGLDGQVERVTADLRDARRWPDVLAGADSVVHLAGNPSPEISAREAVEDVAMSTAHLAAAAAGEAGLRRVVYASSIHASGLYQRSGDHPIDPRWPPRPCCEYGSAKVLCENLLALLVQRSAVSVISLRLGMTGMLPRNAFQASHWLGDDDCIDLMRSSLTAESSGAYFGMSKGGCGFWELSPTTADLGFTPQQLPPSPRDPQPERVGRCLMHG